MRGTILLVALVVAVSAAFAAGCAQPVATPQTTATTAAVAATGAVPNLTGVWTGTWCGAMQKEGFATRHVTVFITAQQGEAFMGYKEYVRATGNVSENLTGIVRADGSVYESDSDVGTARGTLTGPNAMELVYLEDGADTKALILRLTRQGS